MHNFFSIFDSQNELKCNVYLLLKELRCRFEHKGRVECNLSFSHERECNLPYFYL